MFWTYSGKGYLPPEDEADLREWLKEFLQADTDYPIEPFNLNSQEVRAYHATSASSAIEWSAPGRIVMPSHRDRRFQISQSVKLFVFHDSFSQPLTPAWGLCRAL